MQLSKTIAILGLAGLLGAGAAQANVIYNFQATSPGINTGEASGQLVVTDAAFQSGTVSVNDPRGTFPSVNNSPIISASLVTDSTPGITAVVGPAMGINLGDSPNGLIADLSFDPDGLLSGSLSIFSTSDEASAEGDGLAWSVFGLGSDAFSGSNPAICQGAGPTLCDGGTGFWQLDASTVPTNDVPAPPAWGFFGLAALGLFGAVRRRAPRGC